MCMVFLRAKASSTVREEGIIGQLLSRVTRIDDGNLTVDKFSPRIENQVDALLLFHWFNLRNCLSSPVRTSSMEKNKRERS